MPPLDDLPSRGVAVPVVAFEPLLAESAERWPASRLLVVAGTGALGFVMLDQRMDLLD